MSELGELLARVLREQEGLRGLRVRRVVEQGCTNPGDNFLSDVSVAEVRGELDGQPYSGRVFVKRPPSGGTVLTLGADAAFFNEALVYGTLLNDVTVCARCLFANSDVILLQDLSSLGYRMPSRPGGLPAAALPSVMRALAKFHCASFSRLRANWEFRQKAGRLRPMGLALSGDDTLDSGLRRMQALARTEDSEVLGRLRSVASERARALRKPEAELDVLAHGDFWLNNLMLDETQAQPEPVKIVDLQACAIASPAVDLWTLLYTSIDPSILSDRADSAVDLYCECFLEELRSSGLPSEDTPSASTVKQVHTDGSGRSGIKYKACSGGQGWTEDVSNSNSESASLDATDFPDILSREQYGLLAASLYLPALFLRSPREEVLRAASLDGLLDPSHLRNRVQDLLDVCRRRGVLDRI